MELHKPKIDFAGFGLTTASILYRLPDHPVLLQTFLWQHTDIAPIFPGLRKFLDFWQREIEGALHSVTVAHRPLLTPADLRTIDAEFGIN